MDGKKDLWEMRNKWDGYCIGRRNRREGQVHGWRDRSMQQGTYGMGII